MTDETTPLDPERPCSRCGHAFLMHANPRLPAGPWCAGRGTRCEFREARCETIARINFGEGYERETRRCERPPGHDGDHEFVVQITGGGE